MPFGAHEAMEIHEILNEKVNAISHFNLYATQTKNPELKQMITRHLQAAIQSYDAIVAYTHDYHQYSPIPANTNISQVKPEQIQYGLNNPTMVVPETNASLNDFGVASAMLLCHKNSASNSMKASLEMADPNLRQMLVNSAVNCSNQAYEVFLYMNNQGLYQVPKIKDHTAKTYLHSYQPSGDSINTQYAVNPGQSQGYDQSAMAFMNESHHMGQAGSTASPHIHGQQNPQNNVSYMNRTGTAGMVGQQGNQPPKQTMSDYGQMFTGGMKPGSQQGMQQYRGSH
ncbi:spore coat protein [Bacillus sp. FJAT-27251]|uniref:spore coat protein n=1 Tax=Bacillus sp. FJAT-27251 TaxID=1684142 RepID=UPI000840EB0B|nr:spore coat protein [Bacillus sp. FJAT-27251]